MQATLSDKVETVAYLKTAENETQGFYGALLIVTQNARPIEFHCTQPVRPKPAQRVLYGATLKQYLLSEQIPRCLTQKAKSRIDVLLVDDPDLIGFRLHTELPIGLITENKLDRGAVSDETNDKLVIGDLLFLNQQGQEFAIHVDFASDQGQVATALSAIARNVDRDEPFERLAIAMEETCKSSAQAA